MPPVTTQDIVFANNRSAKAALADAGAQAPDIIAALGIKSFQAVLLLIGGADSIAPQLEPKLIQLFGRGVARAAATVQSVIVDGGTAAGVMAMMGQGVADRGYKSSLIGVVPNALVQYPGSTGSGTTPLDPNHSHFVLVDGNAWGNETRMIFRLVDELKKNVPAVVLVVGGGAISRNEVLLAVRQNLPLIVVDGSGGFADEIAAAWKARPDLPDEPVMAEIIADGNIAIHQVSDPVKGIERMIVSELGGDNVLMQAWTRFADYDLNATLQENRFERLQFAIIVIGVAGTALALIKQVKNPDGVILTTWKDWWFYRPWSGSAKPPQWIGWWLSYYVLIMLPIVITILISAANRFKQGNKWLLLRSGAEAIKREIFRYRARAGDYKEVFSTAPPPAPAPGVSAAPPLPTPEQVLAQRVEDVTRRVMQTEVNSTSLIPYDKRKGFPPDVFVAECGDDGLSVLTPDRYVQARLVDQLRYYRRKAVEHERKLKVIQWTIFIIGGVGTLLAAVNRQVWIALTTTLTAALTTYLSYRQTESTLMKYNQAATDLDNVRSWWTALPAADQTKQANVDVLVDHTERVLQSEMDGWVQQMQNALAELRKGQEKAPENAQPATGPDPNEPSKVAASLVVSSAEQAGTNGDSPAPVVEPEPDVEPPPDVEPEPEVEPAPVDEAPNEDSTSAASSDTSS
jgi:hypothetical protein